MTAGALSRSIPGPTPHAHRRAEPHRGRRRFSPAQVLVITFAVLIAAGTVLLRMPLAAAQAPLSWLDAAFTATSAVCVTGLVVVDTPHALSVPGQLVLLLLVQLGGLGYMAITTVVGVALGRALSVHERLTLQEALNVQTMEGLFRFALTVLKLTLVFELAGAALLTAWWTPRFGFGRAAYLGVFHAITAFNNAGFALFSDSLIRFQTDWVVNLVITALVVCGGLGFVVLTELGRMRRHRRLSAHTRLVLALTAFLIVSATLVILLIERRNPATLGPLALPDAVLAAYFQAVTPRTAGFNTVEIGKLMPASLFLLMILMFVGAAPGGTGGGVKITTISITVAALWAMVRGSTEPSLLRRRLPAPLVARAFSIALLGFLALNAVASVLLVVEGRDLLPTLFETASAFGTVGLSTGVEGSAVNLVGHFSPPGKLLVMAMMFIGRVGPLTLAVAVARAAQAPARLRYPEGKILVG